MMDAGSTSPEVAGSCCKLQGNALGKWASYSSTNHLATWKATLQREGTWGLRHKARKVYQALVSARDGLPFYACKFRWWRSHSLRYLGCLWQWLRSLMVDGERVFFSVFFPVNPSVICKWISIKIERVNVIKSMDMYKDIDILCIKHEWTDTQINDFIDRCLSDT